MFLAATWMVENIPLRILGKVSFYSLPIGVHIFCFLSGIEFSDKHLLKGSEKGHWRCLAAFRCRVAFEITVLWLPFFFFLHWNPNQVTPQDSWKRNYLHTSFQWWKTYLIFGSNVNVKRWNNFYLIDMSKVRKWLVLWKKYMELIISYNCNTI